MKRLILKLLPDFLTERIKKFVKKRRLKQFKNNSVSLTKNSLVEGFKNAGLKKGDSLFIHSSLRGLGYIENGPNTVIEAFKDVVGKEGTLIFPTFTIYNSMQDTLSNKEIIFNPITSKSTTGAITNAFLNSKNVKRSIHPTHSVAAWGKHADYLTSNHYEASTNFGKETPFGKLLELKGKIVGLGINYGPVTYYHVYEDLNLDKFNGVYLPTPFKSKITDYHGNIIDCKILCHNPIFHKNRIDKNPEIESYFSKHFDSNNISSTTKIGEGNIWWIESNRLLTELEKLYSQNITIYNV